MSLEAKVRPCGHLDWVDMLGAPCLECRLQKTLKKGVAKIRAAAGLPPAPEEE